MLGAAGLGKSFEQAYLADLDRAESLDVIADRLAVLGQTADGLRARLDTLATSASSNTALYLDALDEVMVPVRTAGLIVQRWITDQLAKARPRLRLSCRTAVWPPGVRAALEGVYGPDSCAFAVLQPLSEKDVRSVATACGVDGAAFLRAVDVAGVRPLAEQPLTLEMLLRIHKSHGTLPKRRRDLFRQGMEQLAMDRRERTREGTATNVPQGQLLEGAERLACLCLLSGHDVIDFSESPTLAALSAREIEGLPGDQSLDAPLLDAICRSGLCDGDGPDRFRFAHRQFAEYLAGRRLARLLPHQARSLLGAGATWQTGVAGPLRETAAFAAMQSPDIAAWITDQDPEVVGLSDVADDAQRRRATLNLLAQFRRHELTDSQIGHDGIELAGFQYPHAERDLRPVLQERADGCQDVIECAIELIESWGFSTMSGDLASLLLDPAAPIENRKRAGYALAKIGTPEARGRLLPLVTGGSEDQEFDLKGLALRCNWPDRLGVPELLAALTPPPRSNYHGAYDGFLHELDFQGFDARGHRLAGLRWARQFARENREYSWTTNIVRRIAIASLDELDRPGIADALAELMQDAATVHAGSPLEPPHRFSLDRSKDKPPAPILNTKPAQVRRALIDAVAARPTSKEHDLWWIARETPGLLNPDDFPWLIDRAIDPARPTAQRDNYAELASMLPWYDSVAGVEAWFNARDKEPVASRIKFATVMELASEEAEKARKAHADMKRWNRPPKRRRLRPSPQERVKQVLDLSETKDPRFFFNICQELTLKPDSTHYGFARFLTKTPGWESADESTQTRIVEAAKRFLTTPSDEPDRAKTEPLNRVLPGHMPAIWLVMARDLAWIDALPIEWWETWAWYILRELRPRMVDEPEKPQDELLRRLHARVPETMRKGILGLSRSKDSETHGLLTSLLEVMEDITDPILDDQLCNDLERGTVPDDRVGDVAQFVLTRSSDRALPACLTQLAPEHASAREDVAVRAAVALLHERTREAWSSVFGFLRRRPDLAARVLGDFAHGHRIRSRGPDREEPAGLATLAPGQIGQLVALLLEAYPPESDPHHDGAHFVGADDSARQVRDQLVSWLGNQKDLESVEALRSLERTYGAKYSWLRRPRARAERAYRLSQWEPVPPLAVAAMLAAQKKRLLRSGTDALDGVAAAVDDYSRRLHHESPSELDDLWNQPKNKAPSPKEEERVSDKVCAAVRSYFHDFAVVASREVQVFRRKLAKARGGAPGSEVDVLCDIPPAFTPSLEPIRIPIEVKLAHNPEARSGLRNQLAERYMSELGTGLGVYVVVWMGNGTTVGRGRALWDSPTAALKELEDLAKQVIAASPEPVDIRCVVIDASLPIAARVKRKPAGVRSIGSKQKLSTARTTRRRKRSAAKGSPGGKPSIPRSRTPVGRGKRARTRSAPRRRRR